MDSHPVFESVPNFSEGNRPNVIAEIAGAASRAHILDVDADADHNRVVISLAGQRADLLDALFSSAQAAIEKIDVREHRGVHPRVGAADVIPIIPLGNASPEAARELALELGDRIWNELRVPVFFYGHGEANTLADVRAGRSVFHRRGSDVPLRCRIDDQLYRAEDRRNGRHDRTVRAHARAHAWCHRIFDSRH